MILREALGRDEPRVHRCHENAVSLDLIVERFRESSDTRLYFLCQLVYAGHGPVLRLAEEVTTGDPSGHLRETLPRRRRSIDQYSRPGARVPGARRGTGLGRR